MGAAKARGTLEQRRAAAIAAGTDTAQREAGRRLQTQRDAEHEAFLRSLDEDRAARQIMRLFTRRPTGGVRRRSEPAT